MVALLLNIFLRVAWLAQLVSRGQKRCSWILNLKSSLEWWPTGKGKCAFSNGTNLARGVAILINERLNATMGQTKRDSDGRVVSTQLNIDDNIIMLTNIYAPNQDNERRIFFRQLHTYCSHDARFRIFVPLYSIVLR